MVLPSLTAIDLLFARSAAGPLAFRVPIATLTVLVPLFILLELRSLQSIQLPGGGALGWNEEDGNDVGGDSAAWDPVAWLRRPWPNSLGICPPTAVGCGR